MDQFPSGATTPDVRSWEYREWHYNAKNQLEYEVQPESGRVNYTYDAAGNLWTKTHADPAVGLTTFTYDGNERLRKIDRLGDKDDVDITYDASDNRTQVKNGWVTTNFGFDAVNRLRSREDVVAEGGAVQTFTSSYDYDLSDNLSLVTYPSGFKVRYPDHDTAGRIRKITNGSQTKTYASELAYHPSGAITRYRAGNGVVHNLGYDDRYRLSMASDDRGHLSLTYGYDGVGNVLSILDPDGSQSYTYDGLDRLKTATGPWAPPALQSLHEYEYDEIGNRRSLKKDGVETIYTYNADTSRLETLTGGSAEVLSHNGAGWLIHTTEGNSTYTYTPSGMMETSLSSQLLTTYRYDGDAWRIVKENSGARTYFLRGASGQLLTEAIDDPSDGGVEFTRDYVYAGTRLIAAGEPPREPCTNALIQEGFGGSQLDSDLWTLGVLGGSNDPAMAVAQVNDELEIALAANRSGTHVAGVRTKNLFDLSNAYAQVQLTTPPTKAGTFAVLAVGIVDNYYALRIEPSTARARKVVGGVSTELGSLAFLPEAHRLLRIRHEAATGSVVWEVGDGQQPWAVVATETWDGHVPRVGLRVELRAGTTQAVANPGLVAFDDLQVVMSVVPSNPVVVIDESFDDNTLDTNRWEIGLFSNSVPRPGILVTEAQERLQIVPLTDATTLAVRGIRSVGAYDFSNASVAAQVVGAPYGAHVVAGLTAGKSDAWYQWRLVDTSLVARRYAGGTTVALATLTFDTTTEPDLRYWRIRHDWPSDAAIFETSPDGATWTVRCQEPWDVRIDRVAVKLELHGGSNATLSAPATVLFDNLKFERR